jgi:hypothetical protein
MPSLCTHHPSNTTPIVNDALFLVDGDAAHMAYHSQLATSPGPLLIGMRFVVFYVHRPYFDSATSAVSITIAPGTLGTPRDDNPSSKSPVQHVQDGTDDILQVCAHRSTALSRPIAYYDDNAQKDVPALSDNNNHHTSTPTPDCHCLLRGCKQHIAPYLIASQGHTQHGLTLFPTFYGCAIPFDPHIKQPPRVFVTHHLSGCLVGSGVPSLALHVVF